jgi:hypothetical protein
LSAAAASIPAGTAPPGMAAVSGLASPSPAAASSTAAVVDEAGPAARPRTGAPRGWSVYASGAAAAIAAMLVIGLLIGRRGASASSPLFPDPPAALPAALPAAPSSAPAVTAPGAEPAAPPVAPSTEPTSATAGSAPSAVAPPVAAPGAEPAPAGSARSSEPPAEPPAAAEPAPKSGPASESPASEAGADDPGVAAVRRAPGEPNPAEPGRPPRARHVQAIRGAAPRPPADKVNLEEVVKEGLQAWMRGDHRAALALCRRATQANPGYAPAWRLMGLVHERLGERAAARSAFERYLQASPAAPDATSIRSRMNAL